MKQIALIDALRRIGERFGPSAFVLVLLFVVTWLFADPKSQNEWFRAVMFAEKGRGLPIAVGLLVADFLTGGYLMARIRVGESKEKERLIAERNRLQEELLGRKLTHTKEPTDDDN